WPGRALALAAHRPAAPPAAQRRAATLQSARRQNPELGAPGKTFYSVNLETFGPLKGPWAKHRPKAASGTLTGALQKQRGNRAGRKNLFPAGKRPRAAACRNLCGARTSSSAASRSSRRG